MKWVFLIFISLICKRAYSQECNLQNTQFVKQFFNSKKQWRGESSHGTIEAEINFNKPIQSKFNVDGKTAPISDVQLAGCEKIKFKIEYEGYKYKASLQRAHEELIVAVGVPPIIYDFSLVSL
ncbi:hypothetical protein K2X05_09030 [bacterium]|nr:hypothetical protein [bacterium]